MADVTRIAAEMARSGRGILAADESVSVMNARLAKAGVPGTTGSRRAFREMLVTTPHLSEGVSGVILGGETFRQALAAGQPFPDALAARGLLPGIRVDAGRKPLAGAPGEKITEGLDGLGERLAGYARLGARFATWRAVFMTGDGRPSWRAIRANAHAVARYAALCHEADLVPVIEPEVLMDGAHTIEQCAAVTSAVMFSVFAELQDFGVALEAVVLSPDMALPGAGSGQIVTPAEVAARTVGALDGIVPGRTTGVAFLSGGQDPAAATANLAGLQWTAAPWPLTFSFGRALDDPALAAWRGEPGRAGDGQRALANRVACNLAALRGAYRPADADQYALA